MNPEIKVEILENNAKERAISDSRYSPILVQKIVFGFVTTMVIAVVSVAMGIFDKRSDKILNPPTSQVVQESLVEANI